MCVCVLMQLCIVCIYIYLLVNATNGHLFRRRTGTPRRRFWILAFHGLAIGQLLWQLRRGPGPGPRVPGCPGHQWMQKIHRWPINGL